MNRLKEAAQAIQAWANVNRKATAVIVAALVGFILGVLI